MKAILNLLRYKPNGNILPGVMYILITNNEGKQIMGYKMASLENEQKKIPTGTYNIKNTYSPKFKKKLLLVDKVPGRSGIRIHPFNKAEESKGCITVGLPNINMLINTTNHCNFLQNLVVICDKATINITNYVYPETKDNQPKNEK